MPGFFYLEAVDQKLGRIMYKILVINPGSTSTKIALFHDNKKIIQENIIHDAEENRKYPGVWDQYDMRLGDIQSFIKSNDIDSLSAVVGRGGLLRPVRRGVYPVNDLMLKDARSNYQGEHISNIGCALAHDVAQQFDCPAFVVDPVSVDEFEPVARISGHPLIERRSLSHALNLRAAAIWAAEKLAVDVNKINFIVAHLGGGISVAPVQAGRIIDVNDASSDGPFSPERTGGLPLQPFIKLCFSGKYSEGEMKKMVMGKGGLVAYTGSADLTALESRMEQGDSEARLLFQAMAYQIAKEIGAMATVLSGDVAAIVLTGGLAKSGGLVAEIEERVRFIAPIIVFPGELEMEAMAAGALRVLTNKELPLQYGDSNEQ